jgi:hypothetical protein
MVDFQSATPMGAFQFLRQAPEVVVRLHLPERRVVWLEPRTEAFDLFEDSSVKID